jgi:hypothetical protein
MINNAAKRLWEKPTHAMVSIIKTKLNQICQFENKESKKRVVKKAGYSRYNSLKLWPGFMGQRFISGAETAVQVIKTCRSSEF